MLTHIVPHLFPPRSLVFPAFFLTSFLPHQSYLFLSLLFQIMQKILTVVDGEVYSTLRERIWKG